MDTLNFEQIGENGEKVCELWECTKRRVKILP